MPSTKKFQENALLFDHELRSRTIGATRPDKARRTAKIAEKLAARKAARDAKEAANRTPEDVPRKSEEDIDKGVPDSFGRERYDSLILTHLRDDLPVKLDPEEEEQEIEILPGQIFVDPNRQQWPSRFDFLLSTVGYAVGFGSLFTFPRLALTNGGGTFLIPYLILMTFCTIPLFYLESLIGQFVRQGTICIWKICPIFRGIGYCMVLDSCLTTFYFIVILVWSVVYIYESFYSDLRWLSCGNHWNTHECLNPAKSPDTGPITNMSYSSMEFFQGHTVRIWSVKNESGVMVKGYQPEMHQVSNPDVGQTLILLVIIVLLYLLIFFGKKFTGKVVWPTVIVPYFIMAILLFRGATLPGSSDGIALFLKPDFKKLVSLKPWADAAFHVFSSSGIGIGVHLTYASYNNFQHKLLWDIIFSNCVNCITNIVAGIIVFAFLGNVSYAMSLDLELKQFGPELVFEVLPNELGSIPGANFFAFLFFMMVLLLGIDCAIGSFENVVTGLWEDLKGYPLFHGRYAKHGLMVGIFAVSFGFNALCLTRGGMYWFTLFYVKTASVSVVFAYLLQTLVLGWVYGLQDVSDGVEAMSGRPPQLFFKICWKFVTPIFLFILFVLSLHLAIVSIGSDDSKKEYRYGSTYNKGPTLELPTWGKRLGLLLSILPMTIIPIYALYKFIVTTAPTYKLKFLLCISPENEHAAILMSGEASRSKLNRYLWLGLSKDHDPSSLNTKSETDVKAKVSRGYSFSSDRPKDTKEQMRDKVSGGSGGGSDRDPDED